MSYTPNYNLETPYHGAYENSWDVPLNANFTAIDLALFGLATSNRSYSMPAGMSIGSVWYDLNWNMLKFKKRSTGNSSDYVRLVDEENIGDIVGGGFLPVEGLTPPVPENLDLGPNIMQYNGQVTLYSFTAEWDDISTSYADFDSYMIQIASTSGPPILKESQIKTNSFTFDGLLPDTTWNVKVLSISKQGQASAWCTAVPRDINNDTTAPPVPQNINVTFGLSAALVTWDDVNVNDIAGYEVYANTVMSNPTDNTTRKAVVPKNSALISLMPNTNYFIYVRAFDRTGNLSNFSIPFAGHTSATLSSIGGNSGEIELGSVTILGNSSFLRSGQSDYNVGQGFWLGMKSGVPKFSIGNSAGNYLTWDTTLGALTLKGNITLGSNNNIKAGQTAFNTGIGFFLGKNSLGKTQFSLGDPNGNSIKYDETDGTLLIKGQVLITGIGDYNTIENKPSFTNQTIGLKENYISFLTQQNGQAFICGYNTSKEIADIDGSVFLGNSQVQITKGPVFTSLQNVSGYILVDTSNSNRFTVSSSSINKVFVQKVSGSSWRYDSNNGTWITFTVSPNDTIIGKIVTDPSTTNKISSSEVWQYGITPDTGSTSNALIGNEFGTSIVPPLFLSSPPVSGTGLYANSRFLGFINSGTWKTYMDNVGGFYLSGSGSNSLSWNGTTLSIHGDINVASTIGGVPIGSVIDVNAPTLSAPTITNNADGRAKIQWNKPSDTDLAGYNVWRGTTNLPNDAILVYTTTNIANDPQIYYDTVDVGIYYYWVSAFDKSGNESAKLPNSPVSITITDTTSPSAPTSLVIKGGAGRIYLSWLAPTDKIINKYKIVRSDTSDFAISTTVYSGDASYIEYDRSSTAIRYYRVYSMDKLGNTSLGYLSGSGAALVPGDESAPNRPSTPASVVSDLDGRNIIQFTGSTSADADSYRIVRHTCTAADKTGDDGGIEIGLIRHNGIVSHRYVDSNLEKNKYYYYEVYCIDNSGLLSTSLLVPSSIAQIAVDITPPSNPAINLIQPKIGAITIGWSSVTSAFKYNIYRYLSDGTGELFIGSTLSLQWTDNSPATDTISTYSYKITAVDSWNNESPKSDSSGNITSLTPSSANDPTPPTVGTISNPIANANGTVTISWSGFSDNGSGVGGYNVWRATSSTGTGATLLTSIRTTNQLSFNDKSTIHATTYYYWITCFDNTGNETTLPVSGWKSVTANDTTVPTSVSNVLAVARLGRIDVTWSRSTSIDVVGYDVYRSTDSGSTWVLKTTVETNSYTEYGITALVSVINMYRYKIIAVDTISLRDAGVATTISPDTSTYRPADGVAPNSVAAPTTTNDDDGRIIISWVASTSADVEKYKIYRSLDNITYTEIATTSSLIYTDSYLKNNQNYYYKISVLDWSGMESNLSSASAATKAIDTTAPTPPAVNAVGDLGAIRVTWTEIVELNCTYEVWRCAYPWVDANAVKIASIAGGMSNGSGSFIDYSPPIDTSMMYTYKLKVQDRWGNLSGFGAASTSSSLTSLSTIAGTLTTTAISQLGDIASDGKVTAGEKNQLFLMWKQIYDEYPDIIAKTPSSITTEKTYFTNAYNSLFSYLNGTPIFMQNPPTNGVGWVDNPTTITLPSAANFRLYFYDFWNRRQTLLNAITAVAATTSTWAGTTGLPTVLAGSALAGAPTGGTGLALRSDAMGYYSGGMWKTYMDNTGRFGLIGNGTNSLTWDGTQLLIKGNVTASSFATGGTVSSVSYVAGQTILYVNDTSDFPSSGSLYITNLSRARTYSSKTQTSFTLPYYLFSFDIPIGSQIIPWRSTGVAYICRDSNTIGVVSDMGSVMISCDLDKASGMLSSLSQDAIIPAILGQGTTGRGVLAISSSGYGLQASSETNNAAQFIGNSTKAAVNLSPSATVPISAQAGDIYFNSTTHQFMGYNGTSWVVLG